MGFSERTGTFRRLEDRINDLGDLTAALGLDGPVVTVGHDWGGVISLGWAVAHPQQLAGVVLTNTAVHQPSGARIPPALRLALHPAVHRWGTTGTDSFLRVTHALARPPLTADVRGAFMAPYRGAGRRAGVGNFVADIPADASHPSFPTLSRVAEGVRGLGVPALMLWGPRDPIFSDRYLKDLIGRLPDAKVHRFEGAGHLVAEDRDIAAPVFEWLAGVRAGQRAGRRPGRRLDAGIRGRAPGARRRGPAPLGAPRRAGGGTGGRGYRRRGNGHGRQRRPLAQLAGARTEHRRPRGGPAGRRCRERHPGEPDGSPGRGPDRGPLRLPAARRGGHRGRRRPGHPRPEPCGEGRHPGLPHRNRQGPGGRLGTWLAGTAHQCAGPAGPPPPAPRRRDLPRCPCPPRSRPQPRTPPPGHGPGSGPGRPRRGAVHLRFHRARQGRGLHAPAAGSDARCRGRDAGDPPGRTPGGGLRAVRPAGTGARSRFSDARHGRHRPPHLDGQRAGARRSSHRRHGGLRLARGAAQRPGHPGRPEPGRTRGAGARGAAALRRRAGP